MSANITQAVNMPPPGVAGTPERTEPTAVTVATTADTAVLPNGGIPSSGCFVTWTSTVDCHLRCGAVGLGNATTADFFLAAGVIVSFWHQPQIHTNFRAIRAGSTDGTIYRYQSNR